MKTQHTQFSEMLFSSAKQSLGEVASDLSVSFHQDFIIENIKKWLTQKSYHSSYDVELQHGLCAGFTTAWLYYEARNKSDYFYSLLREVATWQKGDTTKDEFFSELINILFFFQTPEKLLSNIFQPQLEEKMNLLITTGPRVSPPEFQFSFLFTEAELYTLLTKLRQNLSGRMTFISSGSHIIGLTFDKKKASSSSMIQIIPTVQLAQNRFMR